MKKALCLALLVCHLAAPAIVSAKCSPGLVRHFPFKKATPVSYIRRTKAARRISIQWFGHAFFRIISPGGIRIVTDPFSPHRGYPIPKTSPDVATTSEEAMNHSSVDVLGGNPVVLRGVSVDGGKWNEVDYRIGDVRIRNVPIVQGGGGDDFDVGDSRASSFLFETGGLCIAHLGDLGSPMNPEQLRRLGKVHVALVIISDPGAMNPDVMAKFIHRLRPNVAIPMDVRSLEELNVFLAGFRRVRRIDGDTYVFSRPQKWCSSSTRHGSGSSDGKPWTRSNSDESRWRWASCHSQKQQTTDVR